MTSWFLDSNSIADWMLNKLVLEQKESYDEAVRYLKNLKDMRQDSLYAFLSIDSIYFNNRIHDFRFFTSSLAVSEVISVIYDKYITDELYRKSIPLKYWYKVKYTINLPNKILNKISYEIIKFHMTLISRNKIRLLNDLIIQDTIKLITKLKCETHDAYLLSQSIFPQNKCDYFVTSDNRLKENIGDSLRNKIIKPRYLYDQLKKAKNIKLNFKDF